VRTARRLHSESGGVEKCATKLNGRRSAGVRACGSDGILAAAIANCSKDCSSSPYAITMLLAESEREQPFATRSSLD